MNLDELINSLSSRLGLPDLALNDAGVACFGAGEAGIDILIEKGETDSEAFLYSVVGQMPDEGDARQRLAERLLEAQLFESRIGPGFSLGLDPESGEVLLNRKIIVDRFDQDTFYEAVSNLFHWSRYWAGSIQDICAEMNVSARTQAADETLPQNSDMIRA